MSHHLVAPLSILRWEALLNDAVQRHCDGDLSSHMQNLQQHGPICHVMQLSPLYLKTVVVSRTTESHHPEGNNEITEPVTAADMDVAYISHIKRFMRRFWQT